MLRGQEMRDLAMVEQHPAQHVIGHARREVGVDDPHQGDVARQVRVEQEMIDAGPGRRDQPEVAERPQKAARHAKDHADVDIVGVAHVRPGTHVFVR